MNLDKEQNDRKLKEVTSNIGKSQNWDNTIVLGFCTLAWLAMALIGIMDQSSGRWAHIGIGLITFIFLCALIVSILYNLFDRNKLKPSGNITTMAAFVLQLDERFRYLQQTEIERLLPNICWYLLEEIAQTYPKDARIGLKKPRKHVEYFTDGKDMSVILKFFINPMKNQEITDYVLEQWRYHLNEAYRERRRRSIW